MKKLHLALVSLGVMLLAAGCGGGGGGGGIPTAAVKITTTNATDVAKSANTSAQGMAKSGAGMAGFVGVVAQSSGPSRSVLDISLAQFARVRGLQLAPSGGVVGVISGFPMTYNCATGAAVTSGAPNTMTMDIQDKNNNATIDSGDVLVMSFSSCNEGTSTMNGGMTFTMTTLNGALGGTGTPSAPLKAAFTLSFNNLSNKDNATGATDMINGDITFSTSDDGTNIKGTMSGTSLSMTSSVDGAFQMSSYNISFTEADYPTASTPYSFTFNMTTASVVAGGSITITTTTPFTGVGTGNPIAGVMVITGANNSTLILTALSDGQHVHLVVDDDGAAGPDAPVAITPDTTWAAL